MKMNSISEALEQTTRVPSWNALQRRRQAFTLLVLGVLGFFVLYFDLAKHLLFFSKWQQEAAAVLVYKKFLFGAVFTMAQLIGWIALWANVDRGASLVRMATLLILFQFFMSFLGGYELLF